MGKADWSLDHLEHDLAAGFALLGRAESTGGLGAGESAALAEGVLRCMNGALQRVSESLESQSRLRHELALERQEFHQAQAAQAERIQSLEAELAALRQASLQERRRVQRALARLAPEDVRSCPPGEHLSRPLVLRSSQGEFLGVTDRMGQALSLAGFLRLVEDPGRGAPGRSKRLVASCWDACGAAWSLSLCISGPPGPRNYVLETRALRTPSGNQVTLLAEMRMDAGPVPQDFMVQMFRQLRESLQEE